jgi:hypothetical protein
MPELEFNGIMLTAAKRAAEEVGFSRDYIARLCKRGAVVGHRTQNGWYVDMRSLRGYLEAQEHARQYRREDLARKRTDEYRRSYRSHSTVKTFGSGSGSAPQSLGAATVELKEKMMRAFEGNAPTRTAVLSDASSLPSGITHAAFQSAPAQALTHVPLSALTPAAEVLHKIAALATTFLILVGIFVLVAPTQSARLYGALVTLPASERVGETAGAVASLAHSAQTLLTIEDGRLSRFIALGNMGAAGASATVAIEVVPHSAPVASAAVAEATKVVTAVSQTAAAASSLGTPATATQNALADASVPANAEGSIATDVVFSGQNVSYGDLISYDPTTHRFTLTSGSNDPNAYGIAVQSPALMFSPSNGGDVPVLRSGSALANVTLENGPIAIGDPLTASSIPGKARKANPGEHTIGTADESFNGQGGVQLRMPDGTVVSADTIRVTMNIGGASEGAAAGSPASCTSLGCKLFNGLDPALVRAFAKYLLSGIIAALALFFAFKSFVTEANYGVISMGRNPLARRSIQSMVLINALLALAIASAGLFASIVVLFAIA